MTGYANSDFIKMVLIDNDEVWPTTVSGSFRVITKGDDHNILGKGENNISELDMINEVLNYGKPTRWRSKANIDRKAPRHFSIHSPSVKEVHVNVGGVWVRFK